MVQELEQIKEPATHFRHQMHEKEHQENTEVCLACYKFPFVTVKLKFKMCNSIVFLTRNKYNNKGKATLEFQLCCSSKSDESKNDAKRRIV